MPRNLKKRKNIWWYKIRHEHKDYEGSLQTENLGLAKERLERKRQELKATSWGEKPRRTFNQAAERFGAEHFKELKPSTRKRYLVSIANLLNEFDGARLDEVGSARLGDFEQARKRDKVSSSTIRRDLACFSVIYTFAEQWEWATHNPVKPFLRARSLSGLVEGDPRERHLSHEEESLVLEFAPQKAAKSIIFAIDTGLRKEEQFSLLWTDVDFRKREITVRKEVAKNNRERKVPILPRTLDLLSGLPRHIRSPYVFVTYQGERYSDGSPTNYEALQKAVRRAGEALKRPLEHVEWHDLRRTCGCRLLQDLHLSMEETSRWLGHSSVKVTERHYAFLKVEQLHKALARRGVVR